MKRADATTRLYIPDISAKYYNKNVITNPRITIMTVDIRSSYIIHRNLYTRRKKTPNSFFIYPSIPGSIFTHLLSRHSERTFHLLFLLFSLLLACMQQSSQSFFCFDNKMKTSLKVFVRQIERYARRIRRDVVLNFLVYHQKESVCYSWNL